MMQLQRLVKKQQKITKKKRTETESHLKAYYVET